MPSTIASTSAWLRGRLNQSFSTTPRSSTSLRASVCARLSCGPKALPYGCQAQPHAAQCGMLMVWYCCNTRSSEREFARP